VELARGEADSAVFDGGTVSLEGAQFTGGTVDFSEVLDWSAPPKFDPRPLGDMIKFPEGSHEQPDKAITVRSQA
jgi:hypothetical protein